MSSTEGSRLLLQALNDSAKPKQIVSPTPNHIAIAAAFMIRELMAMPVPSIPVQRTPADLDAISHHLLEQLAPIIDRYVLAVGHELAQHSPCEADLERYFTSAVRWALEDAAWEARQGADILQDEINERGER